MAQAPSVESEKQEVFDRDSIYRKHTEELNRRMLSGESLSGNERNCAFLNRGAARFATISGLTGFDYPDDARAVASCDWDGDGRLDFWTSHRNAPQVRFYHNEHPEKNWLALEVKGAAAVNRDGIGTRVFLTSSNKVQTRTLRAGSGYLSQGEKLVHFGLGESREALMLKVRWPDGTEKNFEGVEQNHRYRVTYPGQLERLTKRHVMGWSVGQSLPAEEFEQAGHWALAHRIPLPDMGFTPKAQGKWTLVSLWNPACDGCDEELQALVDAKDKLHAAGVAVVIALGPGEAGAVEAGSAFERENTGFSFVQLSEGNTLLLRDVFKMLSRVDRELLLPSSILLDEDHRIALAWLGAMRPQSLLEKIASLSDPPSERWIERPQRANHFAIPLALLNQNRLEDAADFVRRHSSFISAHKDYPLFLTWIGDGKMQLGQSKEALAFYLNALKSGAKDPVVMNNVAWQLATHPDPSVRNGAEALKWAKAAVALQPDDPSTLDTLGAAQAECGDFGSALATVEKAIQLALQRNLRDLLPGLAKARQHYHARQAMRQRQ